MFSLVTCFFKLWSVIHVKAVTSMAVHSFALLLVFSAFFHCMKRSQLIYPFSSWWIASSVLLFWYFHFCWCFQCYAQKFPLETVLRELLYWHKGLWTFKLTSGTKLVFKVVALSLLTWNMWVPCWQSAFSNFKSFVHLVGVEWDLTVVLICFSLITSVVKHVLIYYLSLCDSVVKYPVRFYLPLSLPLCCYFSY
jgi:hypothetical protein